MKQLAPLRSRLTALLPEWVRRRRTLNRMVRHWRASSPPPVRSMPVVPPARLFIIPPDTDSLTGSRGDEAMLLAIAATLRHRRADLAVSVLTSGDGDGAAAAHDLGFEPVRGGRSFAVVIEAIRATRPDALVVVGADMMDGHYSPVASATRLLAADRLARDGVPTVVSGFSFNAKPQPSLAPLFDALDPRVALRVRDPLSLQRLQRFCRAPATLVADPAFLLQPDACSPRIKPVLGWIQARRSGGERVFAVNLHPGLVRNAGADAVQRLAQVAASALMSISTSQPVSWLLLAHDFRGGGACAHSLALLEQAAGRQLGCRLLRPSEEFSAAELKAITGTLDGLVSGRMHLAIAALGQGTPVACLTYQDKFHGLLEHFALPQALAMSPKDALQDGAFETLLRGFLGDVEAYRRQVAQRLPAVMALSEHNLSTLLARADGHARRAA